jgi:hypothetical protein
MGKPSRTVKAKAEGEAKGKAKSSAESKETHKDKKVTHKDRKEIIKDKKEIIKDKANAKVKPITLDQQAQKAKNGNGKGGDDITEDGMGKLGNMAVLDKLKQLAKKQPNGEKQLMHYKTLKGQEKLDFAVQLKVDRDAAFMTVKESHKMENSKTQQAVEGWIIEPLVAQHEGIINYNTDATQRALLDDILAGLPSRPHERPDLAAKGWKQYEYSSKLLNIHKQDMKQGMEVQAECHVKDKGDFEAMVQQMGNPGNFTKGPTRKVTHASSSAKALTEKAQKKR